MYFSLIDRIVKIQPGKRILATKRLSSLEPYLRDHFPGFPVMPGVLMLEAVFQTSAWLLAESHAFAIPMPQLRQARNVKYGRFVKPGDLLFLEAEIIKQQAKVTTLKTSGKVGPTSALSARLLLECPSSEHSFSRQRQLRRYFTEIYKPYRESANVA